MSDGEKIIGIDGVMRSPEAEHELNALAAEIFDSPRGKALLHYLRRITINAVHGPDVTDAHLRHFEGQRYLVALLERRRDVGREPQPKFPGRRQRRRPAAQ